ncbi:1-acyl-sn-glycerol-3-phosphate acyltransferase [Pararhizobium capsulatum DSM 1112]|uniref:1-acyl-sn-glycerol-3-phosphate acyltransferase n=1 Tax=Pararhizobium capsulatum DSM 1112 TaxID=1121113 RepID=A0ABU0BK58_9HYPH|nr:lysophospholipid acyltransferase family protein [Pararhizobium capsulatum]MDQ0318392.1 1-acyl-sn-glycerol-3-phosphate acyltransferase [Pararhizobium capsulatum DSM 1112]
MKALITRPVAMMIVVFARALTAVRAIWPETGLPAGQCVYFANHSSHGDFILIWSVLPPWMRVKTRPVAGAEYWLATSLKRFIGCDVFNAVLIERDREKRTGDPIARMAETLDAGSSLILFPEGTRNETDEPILPFKSGLYNLATLRPDIDLAPVWIDNLNRVMPKGEIVPIPLICTVTFGDALRLRPDESREAFLARTSAALLSLSPKITGAAE